MKVVKRQTLRHSNDIRDLSRWLQSYHGEHQGEIMRVYVVAADSEMELMLQWIATGQKIITLDEETIGHA